MDIEGAFGSQLHKSQEAIEYREPAPIDMIIFCPSCHKQHIDRADLVCGSRVFDLTCRRKKHHTGPCSNADEKAAWTNPVHKSHTCRIDDGGCGIIFRVADVPTNGVAQLKTVGSDDTWLPESVQESIYSNGGGA